ncbi:MAG TPA: efflux RND transporter periplasmic adaptor subunit [Polyangiaceae bacterium]|nr:efflux RND transporter periplasmic adaptor subunit [Polyangiaceae bacterium]
MTAHATETPTKPVKAPLGGIIVGIILVLGFVAWTGSRIVSATGAKKELAAKRQEESARTQAALNAPSKVHVVTPVAQNWQPVVEFDGTLAAAQAAGLGFKVGGRISSVRVKVGDEVKAGALLATLDTTESGAQLKAAEAQVRAAQAQLLVAQDEERRTTQMVSTGSVAEAAGVQTTQRAALAAAQLDAATAQVGLVRASLANHSLIAPFAGTVTKVPDGIGAVVAPGAVQFEMVDTRSLRLKSTVSEYDANLLQPGATIQIETPVGTVSGEITAVLSSVDASTRRVPVEAVVKNDDNRLRAGSFVRASIQGGAPISVLKLPHTVLRPGSQDELFSVNGDTLVSRRVVHALDKDGSLLVRSGLNAGEQIVVSPTPEAKTGDKVSVEAAP